MPPWHVVERAARDAPLVTLPLPGTTAADLAGLKPVRGERGMVTAGNASQLSDGASVCVLMEAKV